MVDLLRDDFDSAVRECFVERHGLDFLAVHHTINDRFVMRRQHLGTTGPVDFYGVVAGWIVTGGHHDAAITFFVANGVGQLRRRSIVVDQIDFDASGDHDAGTQFGKVTRLVPRVIGDCARKIFFAAVEFDDVVRQTLGTLANRAIVNRVGSDWIHSTTAPAGSKRNDRPKHIVDQLPFFVVDMLDHFVAVLGVSVFRQPASQVFDGGLADQSVRASFFNRLESSFDVRFHSDALDRGD